MSNPITSGNPDASHLDRQAVTALGTASSQHSTATTGTRANEETVSALTANNGWLICTFHDGGSPESSKLPKNRSGAAKNP